MTTHLGLAYGFVLRPYAHPETCAWFTSEEGDEFIIQLRHGEVTIAYPAHDLPNAQVFGRFELSSEGLDEDACLIFGVKLRRYTAPVDNPSMIVPFGPLMGGVPHDVPKAVEDRLRQCFQELMAMDILPEPLRHPERWQGPLEFFRVGH